MIVKQLNNVENIVEKGELLITSFFFICHNVSKCCPLHMRQNASADGKGSRGFYLYCRESPVNCVEIIHGNVDLINASVESCTSS